jgi:AcrR family transcriptional regulator
MATGSRTKNRVSKAEQARETRRRITAAAITLFVRDGFLTTTMAAIAAEAGVAVQTLYLSFGNKTAILHAAFDQAIAGDDEPIPLGERTWFQDMLANPDGSAALTAFVDNSCIVIARAGALYGVIVAAAADPEVAELLANNKHERRTGFAAIVDRLSTRRGFTSALSVADATTVAYAVLSEETYLLMVSERGWTTEQWHDWVLRILRTEFFPAQSGRKRSSASTIV